MEDVMRNCIINLKTKRWDFVEKSYKFTLELVVTFMCSIHHPLEIEVDLLHKNRYNISMNLADRLFNVV